MKLIYVIINFAILAVVLYIFGRKTVVRMFSQRRQKIVDGLQKAEAGRRAAAEGERSLEQLRAEAQRQMEKQAEDAQEQRALRQAALEQETAEAALRLQQDTEQELTALRQEMLQQLHREIVRQTVEQSRHTLTNPTFAQRYRVWEKELGNQLLQHARMTPGNLLALRQTGKLRAGVVSAFPLEKEEEDRLRSAMESLLPPGEGQLCWQAEIDPKLIGGLQLRIGDMIYDGSIDGMLRLMEQRLVEDTLPNDLDPDTMAETIRQKIAELSNEIDICQWGQVLSVSDGICWADGLADAMYGELVEFETGERGMVLSVEANRVAAVIFGSYEHIQEKSRVRCLGRTADVPVGDGLLGRVVDALGRPIDGRGIIPAEGYGPVETPAPAILERKSVGVPLETGIKAVDALVPIGRGQRELIIGDRQTGKTALALDTILNQRGKNVLCIYVAVGQKETSVARVVNVLRQNGAMDYTVVVSADASQPSPLRYLAPYAGTAMGEHFMRKGRDVLIVYDDLSKHADAYREISLLLQRPSGREAYPGDVFYLHSRLLERSARLNEEAGGGSMTALPMVETQAGDISAYIPTNIISITDGQIYLEGDLFRQGQRPAVNVGLSVSRVGGAAQIGAMRQVAGKLRMELAQYRELAAFAQFGSDLDESTQRTLAQGERMTMALRQSQYAPIPVAEQVLVIYAVGNGYADDAAAKDIPAFEQALREYARTSHPALLTKIASGGKMGPELLAELNTALAAFKERGVL